MGRYLAVANLPSLHHSSSPLPTLEIFSRAGAAACTLCPAGSYTAATGAVQFSNVASERRSCRSGRVRVTSGDFIYIGTKPKP